MHEQDIRYCDSHSSSNNSDSSSNSSSVVMVVVVVVAVIVAVVMAVVIRISFGLSTSENNTLHAKGFEDEIPVSVNFKFSLGTFSQLNMRGLNKKVRDTLAVRR
ncbi:hypothetical protein HZH66_013220 [Vespula vulgaris]|uniref:Uncharacterized protein n=1 Tax=Vespula vulgaris TaxID=7454 RepID=A0A834MTW9_VESVU|nr:hypothetical protein HZH66_013220 [Vespula vulgaris]